MTGPSSERTAERKAMPEDVVHEALRVLVEHAKYPYLDLEEIQAIHTEACEAVETFVEHRAGGAGVTSERTADADAAVGEYEADQYVHVYRRPDAAQHRPPEGVRTADADVALVPIHELRSYLAEAFEGGVSLVFPADKPHRKEAALAAFDDLVAAAGGEGGRALGAGSDPGTPGGRLHGTVVPDTEAPPLREPLDATADANVAAARAALSWALDALEICLQRLDEIDGPFDETHLLIRAAGFAKARAAFGHLDRLARLVVQHRPPDAAVNADVHNLVRHFGK